MRVLLVNKFYYRRGGDCTAVFAMERLLADKGHDVAVFSMQYPENIESPWTEYFPSAIDFSGAGLSGKVAAFMRLFHSREVARKFESLIADFRPDVVHLHNIHSYLSPIVARIAHRKGIRVVWTLHDYKLICPSYRCFRNGRVCEACFSSKTGVIRHKCMKDSRLASMMAYLEACYWNRKKLSCVTNVFISPSDFLKTKMTEAGFSPEQIAVLPNFMLQKPAVETDKGDYYCYVGRISAEKGIESLLQAAAHRPYPLKIIGGGPLLETCRERYPLAHVDFTGQMSPESLYPIVRKARFLVMPSIWYENNPYSVIEALCMGTPVLGARIGGIPELIREGENGYLFDAGNVASLLEKIDLFYSDDAKRFDYAGMASEACDKFAQETFYKRLMEIYSGLCCACKP